MTGHIISTEIGIDRAYCSCGVVGTAMSVLDHALPLNIANLHQGVAADPASSPQLRSDADALLEKSRRIFGQQA